MVFVPSHPRLSMIQALKGKQRNMICTLSEVHPQLIVMIMVAWRGSLRSEFSTYFTKFFSTLMLIVLLFYALDRINGGRPPTGASGTWRKMGHHHNLN
jgi:hypothetical protein